MAEAKRSYEARLQAQAQIHAAETAKLRQAMQAYEERMEGEVAQLQQQLEQGLQAALTRVNELREQLRMEQEKSAPLVAQVQQAQGARAAGQE